MKEVRLTDISGWDSCPYWTEVSGDDVWECWSPRNMTETPSDLTVDGTRKQLLDTESWRVSAGSLMNAKYFKDKDEAFRFAEEQLGWTGKPTQRPVQRSC
jgi:hypothetical protein